LIVQFWDELRPYGLEIYEHPDKTLQVFLQQYKTIPIWLGIGHHLRDLMMITKPVVPSVQIPAQDQQILPMAHMPSSSTVQQNAAPTISYPLLSYQPKPQQHLPQPLPSSTQAPPAPEMQTLSIPSTFTATIQAPLNPVAKTSQSTSTTFAPIQQQSVQQLQATQGAPGLLDFNSYKWCQNSDEELLELT
jgi:hypothetical protein